MSKREIAVNDLMDALSATYKDIDETKNPQLKKWILDCAKELEKSQDVDLVSSKLCKAMTINYLSNKENFPKAAVVLFNQLKSKEMKYDGTAILAMSMSHWF